MPVFGLSDGNKMHFEDLGQGTPILLVHGFGICGAVFRPQYELSAGYRLIIPDLRGWGRSKIDKNNIGQKPIDIDTLGDDIFELIEHLGLKNILYVGWSMGALVLWNAAKKHDLSPISQMVSVDMTAKILNEDDWAFGMKGAKSLKDPYSKQKADLAIEMLKSDWPNSALRMSKRVFAIDADLEKNGNTKILLDFLYNLAIANDGEIAAKYWQSLLNCDCRDIVSKFKIPTTLVRGEKSSLYAHEVGDEMHRLIKNSTLVDFTNSGHAPNLEETEKFNALLSHLAAGIEAKNPIASTVFSNT